jgi:hypothetical protein
MKKRNMKNLCAVFAGLTLVVSCLCSCALPVAPQLSAAPAGQLVVKAATTSDSRTVMPTDLSVTKYVLNGFMTDSTDTTFPEQTSTDGSFSVSGLAVGEWTLYVHGYDSNDHLMVYGQTTAKIISSGSTSVGITLLPLSGSGYGSLSITIGWPADKTVDTIVATRDDLSGGVTDLNFTMGANQATYSSSDLMNSSYLLSITLKANGKRVARTLTETALVYEGHTTSWTCNLSDSDFGSGAQVFYHLGTNGSGSVPIDDGYYSSGSKATVLDNANNAVTIADGSDPGSCFISAWNTAENGSGSSYPIGSKIPMTGADVDLYPVWSETNGLLMNGSVVTGFSTAPSGDFIVPEGVTAIGSGLTVADGGFAFGGCTGLTSVSLPSTLSLLQGASFAGCTGLTSVSVAAGNASFSSSGGCVYSTDGTVLLLVPNGLSSPTLLSSVTEIGSGALYGCAKIANLTLPSGLTKIDDYAFYKCTLLKTAGDTVDKTDGVIYIPEGVVSIGDYAFSLCTAIKSVGFYENLKIIGMYAFSGCTACTGIEIPAVSVGAYAFSGCTKIITVLFDGTETIGDYAFSGCTALKGIGFYSPGLKTIGERAFSNCKVLTKVQEYSADAWVDSLPEGTESIGASAFYNCTALTSFSLPSSLTTIGASAFRGCTGLTTLSLPSSLTTIPEYAFYGCKNITSLNLPEGLTAVSQYAFNGCSGITSLTLPTTLATVAPYAFNGCGITSLTIPAKLTCFGINAFQCASLKTVTMLSSLPPSGYAPFSANALTKISVPSYAALLAYRASSVWGTYSAVLEYVSATVEVTVQ